jgi:phospholipase/carboxylesterase
MQTPLFHSVWEDHQADRTLVLLHGTGGDEHSLVELGRQLTHQNSQQTYNLLGLRGNVQEQGMNRFFRRLAMGVFDQPSIQQEAAKLNQFLTEWSVGHNQTADQLVFLGYSNGANMILALAFLYPDLVHRAVLLHPMLPFKPERVKLNQASFLVTVGQQDPFTSWSESQALVKTLQATEAKVELVTHSGGHEVTQEELERVVEFLK